MTTMGKRSAQLGGGERLRRRALCVVNARALA
jgi:hypothetical protein